MARRGFQPRRVQRSSRVELVLERCSFETAAVADSEVVCELHLGLAQGIAEALGEEPDQVALVAYHPKRAGCRLQTGDVEPVVTRRWGTNDSKGSRSRRGRDPGRGPEPSAD